MTLYFNLRASDGSLHSPCVCCAELEIQLEVLNSFVALGNVLVAAYLIDDEGIRIDLPVGAFDGLPIVNCLRNLTKEYQQLLGICHGAK
ncbi:hypothetical protein [Spirosoma pollinicola]|uniref:Uncharacterized protein n=1 Tax=Spirosoma pollinicola TaxID=2057025 RepID=A0A2K8Z9U8_9BACT|nr:hypothetical protein [Spirosoma pollinicola]AUD06653.1 hypothetical protein CWM47_35290 [Spirosoma pollinicola]